MSVEKQADGFVVTHRGRLLAGPFPTNADAWRWIDRNEGQPISKAEERGDWVFAKTAGGTGL
ncbi:hypothetical protein [Shinella sp.]|uniref:hypothetical protein n=1 Tax=Shinella sp. TaxID=1870904 RepID=UPI0028A6685B|nr:hypothetical protein [Shinella sp.]